MFVPYFKYLLEGIVRHLADVDDVPSSALTRKKKKAKKMEASGDGKEAESSSSLPIEKWHLRAVVLSALHKCFLYDTGSLKFLDATNFQVSCAISLLSATSCYGVFVLNLQWGKFYEGKIYIFSLHQ